MLLNSTLERLKTSCFLTRSARATLGSGERRSREKGAGLEFIDHRPYREGDDVRHLDRALLARLGENYLRQYSVDKRLPIYVVIDGSASMRFGKPDKFEYARSLAQALGFIGLNGGDQVQVGVLVHDEMHWSPFVHGTARSHVLFRWIDAQSPSGTASFTQSLHHVARHIKAASLLILISDWWTDEPSTEIEILSARSNDILAFHIVSPEELDPSKLEAGPLDLIDAETNEEVYISIDADVLRRYRAAFREWQYRLDGCFKSRQGRYFAVNTTTDIDTVCTRVLRREGVIT